MGARRAGRLPEGEGVKPADEQARREEIASGGDEAGATEMPSPITTRANQHARGGPTLSVAVERPNGQSRITDPTVIIQAAHRGAAVCPW